jgi:hypothetical protein
MAIAKFEAFLESLIIGERFKREIYRPCLETIPSSTIAGFFRENLGLMDAMGVGIFQPGSYERRWTVGALTDKALQGASLPIETEYLAPVNGLIKASIYLVWNGPESCLASVRDMSVVMGAWRYKGFGRGRLSFRMVFDPPIVPVTMKTRLTAKAAAALGVRRVIAPVFGYLFESTGPLTGHWTRSLFEGSVVEGPEFLGERYIYDV